MIRVLKPARPPDVLAGRGGEATEADDNAFDAEPDAYLSGRRKFRFRNSIYGHRQVKEALIRAQHHKCAFCEAKVTHVYHGDVEHFRPKGSVLQGKGQPMVWPGYYWLAYSWDNLFLACAACNQQGKGNLFPLADPARRARSHRDDVAAETALLIDPGREAPERFIGFRGEMAFAIGGDPRGSVTIAIMGLNRERLVERRLDRLAFLTEYCNVLRNLPDGGEFAEIREKLTAKVRASTADDAEYAAMARALTGSLL